MYVAYHSQNIVSKFMVCDTNLDLDFDDECVWLVPGTFDDEGECLRVFLGIARNL